MAFKSILDFKSGGARTKYPVDKIIYRTNKKKDAREFLISMPAMKAKPAGIEPGMLVDVAYDDATRRCRIKRMSDGRGIKVRPHNYPKNRPAYRYDIRATVVKEVNMPLALDVIVIDEFKIIAGGIEFRIPNGGDNGR